MKEGENQKSLKLLTAQSPAAAYVCVAIIIYLVSTLGADIYAAVHVESQQWEDAALNHLADPVGAIATFAPLLFAGLLGAALHRVVGPAKAISIFAILAGLNAYWYFRGYWAEHVYPAQQLWTAAALSLGFSMMKAAGLVLIACLARAWIAKQLSRI